MSDADNDTTGQQPNEATDQGEDKTQGLDTSAPDDKGEGEDSTQDEGWKDETKVPYRRFEEVVRANQEFRDRFGKEMEGLKEALSSLKSPPSKEGEGGEWTKRAKDSTWDEFVAAIQKDTIDKAVESIKEAETKKAREAEERLQSQIDALYKSDRIKTKAEENAVIKFAIEQSEKTGETIPLTVAYAWMKATQADKGTEDDKKKATKKVQSSKRSTGGPEGDKSSYKELRGKDIDEIIQEEKERLEAGS